MLFEGQDLLHLSAEARRRIIGKDIAMIFQEPVASLNPCFTVGFQLEEVLRVHLGMSGTEAHKRAAELLSRVGIADPEERLRSFPHQMSGDRKSVV